MQRSFSVVQDDDLSDDDREEIAKFDLKAKFSGSDSEDFSEASPKKVPQNLLDKKPDALPIRSKTGRQPAAVGFAKTPAYSSDSEDSDTERKPNKFPGEYDPSQYNNLEVDPEISEVFEYIIKYTPQHMTTEFKFKPFIPEFLPAVGDIDAFLKVVPPETTLAGDSFDENILQLGLLVLDEPASNQSDPALLHLQLRAANDNVMSDNEQKNIVVKKVDNIDKNGKVIDKWIKDISHLHKSKSSPIVRYSQPMPDIEDLMQQWPEDLEQKFKEHGFPKPEENQSISNYIDVVCNYLQIPIAKNKIQSLHLFFCLYSAIKQTQLYQAQAAASSDKGKGSEENKIDTPEIRDQLVLD